jgi:heptosyltransferase I
VKILIIKTSAIGDVIHTLPSLAALRQKYPQARIDWLVEEAAARVLLGHPQLDRVLVSKRKHWTRQVKTGRWRQTWQEVHALVRELRAERYDLLIDFQNLLKSGVFVWLAKAERKAGFGRGMEHSECSYLFLNERIAPVSMDLHAVDRELLLLKALGVEGAGVNLELPIMPAERQAAEELLRRKGTDLAKPLLAINPMTTWETKHWQAEKFSELADRLQDEFAVVFTGGIGDHSAIETICNRMPQPAINLAGDTDLKTLAALYERAAMVVSTDTGPMHVAAAVGTPVVALFGPTAPWRTGPYGDGHVVVRENLDCSPCFKRHCSSRECMKRIAVDRVVSGVRRLWREIREKKSAPTQRKMG